MLITGGGECYSYPTECRKPAIHRDHHAVHKGCARRKEPQYCADQVFRIPEAAHGSVVNDGLPSWSKLTSSLIGQEKAILRG